ncbi:MAG TPA: cytochrome d ubiquinol oxidase subunit II [Polyangiaceae bacterium]
MQTLWFWLTSSMIVIYATLDGFDFGAGILHPFVARTDRERREVLAAIGPYWDGNEVWLIAAGGSMLVAFPKVLAAGFSGLYMALFLVVWTLILRGVAIELRNHVTLDLWRHFWDGVFFVANCLMPIFLGAALGNVLRGVPLDAHGQFSLPLFTHFKTYNPVGILDWYTVLIGLFVFATIVAHGALFLGWKTAGTVRERVRRMAIPLFGGAVLLGLVSTLATAIVNPDIYSNLARRPIAWLGLVAFITAIGLVFFAIRSGREGLALVGSCLFIVGILVATAAAVFPVMLRSTLDASFSLTAFNASVGAYGLASAARWWFLGIPLVIVYFVIVFRLHYGKVTMPDSDEGA